MRALASHLLEHAQQRPFNLSPRNPMKPQSPRAFCWLEPRLCQLNNRKPYGTIGRILRMRTLEMDTSEAKRISLS